MDREQKYVRELENCQKHIAKTKRLIEYHKKMLKSFENKEAELKRKIEKEKMTSLCEIINKGGYDIDLIRKAVKNGDFINASQEQSETVTAVNEENVSEIISDNSELED